MLDDAVYLWCLKSEGLEEPQVAGWCAVDGGRGGA